MQFPITAALFSLTLATLGLGAPTANPSAVDVAQPELVKRVSKAIWMCPAFEWKADSGIECNSIIFGTPENAPCVSLASGPRANFRYTLSSIGPDGGLWCRLYTSTDCTSGQSDAFSYPGLTYMNGYWATWNDNTGSIRCWV